MILTVTDVTRKPMAPTPKANTTSEARPLRPAIMHREHVTAAIAIRTAGTIHQAIVVGGFTKVTVVASMLDSIADFCACAGYWFALRSH